MHALCATLVTATGVKEERKSGSAHPFNGVSRGMVRDTLHPRCHWVPKRILNPVGPSEYDFGLECCIFHRITFTQWPIQGMLTVPQPLPEPAVTASLRAPMVPPRQVRTGRDGDRQPPPDPPQHLPPLRVPTLGLPRRPNPSQSVDVVPLTHFCIFVVPHQSFF